MGEALYDPASDELPGKALRQYRQECADELEKQIEQDEEHFRRQRKPKLSKEQVKLARMTARVARERFEDAGLTMETNMSFRLPEQRRSLTIPSRMRRIWCWTL